MWDTWSEAAVVSKYAAFSHLATVTADAATVEKKFEAASRPTGAKANASKPMAIQRLNHSSKPDPKKSSGRKSARSDDMES